MRWLLLQGTSIAIKRLRQKQSPDQYRALYEKLNAERSLTENDAPVTKNNIHNITKKWSQYSKPLAIITLELTCNQVLQIRGRGELERSTLGVRQGQDDAIPLLYL